MNNTIQYKGYVGSVEFSEEDGIFYGKVMGIRSLISYEGESAKELLDDFHGAIDDYLETCKAEGKQPEIAFKGSFNIRLSPDLHKKLFIYTTAHQISMNKYIEDTLKDSPAAQVVVYPFSTWCLALEVVLAPIDLSSNCISSQNILFY